MDGDGREVLGFIDGEVLADPSWQPGRPTPWPGWAQSEECLVASARLLRASARRVEILRATGERRLAPARLCPALGLDEIVCHGDVGPHNTVYRRGLPVAFIDWDTIRPNDPLVEFGNAAWHFVPLGNDAYFERVGSQLARSRGPARAVRTRDGVVDRADSGVGAAPGQAAERRSGEVLAGLTRGRRRRVSADRE